MKNILKFCVTAALVFSYANSTFAANQSTDLKVQGTLTMGSCTPTLSSDGLVDYGKLSVAALNQNEINQLGERTITLSLECESPTVVGFSVVDDRAGTAADTFPNLNGFFATPSQEFGLGKTTGGINLGSFALLPYSDSANTMIDGQPGELIVSMDNGTSWKREAEPVRNDGDEIVAFASADYTPVALTTASDIIGVSASIQGITKLAITDDTPIDGQATISVVYL